VPLASADKNCRRNRVMRTMINDSITREIPASQGGDYSDPRARRHGRR